MELFVCAILNLSARVAKSSIYYYEAHYTINCKISISGYVMNNDNFLTGVTSFPPYSSSTDFVAHLQTTCQDMHAVLTGKNFKPVRAA